MLDYWVLYIDNDYQYALIGQPSRNYLWAEPTLVYYKILPSSKACSLGFICISINSDLHTPKLRICCGRKRKQSFSWRMWEDVAQVDWHNALTGLRGK
ncbi:hypothetical protein QN277_003448 [Acacia crassicarpa]|uniref:Lipocalin/cytosolic fatty-acid binding domain-containing protein n=1 Tax=Acacia crassicarpa TaxID=499986 RepID=A0AAE1JZB6_9FABA|nr:hypothetical protein QN277_003448 [Acacia crassicarpa]